MFRALIRSRMALACAAAIMVLGFQAADANADFTLTLNKEFSASGSGNLDAGTLEFTNVGSDLLVTLTGGSGLGKIGELYFNLTNIGSINAGSFTEKKFNGSAILTPIEFNFGSNSFKADGDGYFDVMVNLNPSGQDETYLGVGNVLSFKILNTTADQAFSVSVGGPPGKTGFYGAVHAQALPSANGGSGWYTDMPIPTPAPPGIVLAASGVFFCGLGGLVRRFRRPSLAC